MSQPRPSRREFLQVSALALGARGVPSIAHASTLPSVTLVATPGDTVAASPVVTWATDELSRALTARGITVKRGTSLAQAPPADLCVLVTAAGSPAAAPALRAAGVSVPTAAESLAIAETRRSGRRVLVAAGHDARGLMYAVLELADRVEHGARPLDALAQPAPLVERPFNAVRAIGRPFVSDVEDKPWFYDRAFWPAYFSMLARERVNRFHLLFGMGFDTLRWVKDAYLLFAYPFLVRVAGHDVRAVGLPDEERDRNLDALKFISHEAVAHGLDVQLGLWTHGYTWADSDDTNYTIAGLGPANHGAYCRDALAAVLEACPDVTGVTLRTHYESGVKEGSYAFWKTIFDGVPRAGRRREIELHAKGLDQPMIDSALATGMPVRVAPKYWAEHTGLPYQQASIRGLELPHEEAGLDAFSALSFGSRNHTRYGHADFLKEPRAYSVMYRVFPGTHKFLLWGDPVTAAAHARAFRFCGSEGAELFEPLSFKGRRGSGVAGGRCAYVDASLAPARDWEKFRYTYRLWGRMLYNPSSSPDVWRRLLATDYGTAAPAMERALGAATRILPIVTTAHLPSAAQDTYSPEFYTNQSIVDAKAASPYGDTPEPKDAAHVSSLDPELFASVDEYVGGRLEGRATGKYTPVEAAGWIENLAAEATAALTEAVTPTHGATSGVVVRRAEVDVRAQAAMGRFFGAKLRSAALYAVFVRTGDRRALEEAVRLYREARDAWAGFAKELQAVYVADITFGPLPHQRGHWADRVPAMDADIAAMTVTLSAAPQGTGTSDGRTNALVDEILGRGRRGALSCRHTPPPRFTPGAPLALVIAVLPPVVASGVTLRYRHVNQAEPYQAVEMTKRGDGAYSVEIPARYTESPYPLQYHFEVHGTGAQPAGSAAAEAPDRAWLYPGFDATLTNQPYFVVRRG